MTWEDFKQWQRWDEFPENENNPPMTVDFSFHYNDVLYYVERQNNIFHIFDENWIVIASDVNFKHLLESSTWNGKSFRDEIENIVFQP